MRKKSGRVLKLLEKGPLLKEERDKSRKLSRGIQGFGSFTQRSSSSSSTLAQGILREKTSLGRSHSQFIRHENQQENNQLPYKKEDGLFIKTEESKPIKGIDISVSVKRSESSSSKKAEISVKENMDPDEEALHEWDPIGESTSLLLDGKDSTDESNIGTSAEHDHPFSDTNIQSTASLLSVMQ